MSRLREETARQHAQLEETVAIEQRLRSPAAYRELLESFYGFVKPFENVLAVHDWARAGIDFQVRRKASLLEKDLVAVGSAPELVEQCQWLPDASSFDRACGALYVMEGSTLGGQHISRMASQVHVDDEALHYFKSYGGRVGEMWKSLGEALNRFATAGGDESEIVEGARDTFEALRAWFLCKPVAS